MSDTYLYIIFFIVTLIISFFVHYFFYNRAQKYTIKKANPSAIRWSNQSKPISGGITFFAIFFLSILGYFFIFDSEIISNNQFVGIILAVTIAFFMGIADDFINTSPLFKLFAQILSGFILIKFNIYIDLFDNEYINYAFTILWVVGIMNSMNMIDNMDAISSLIAISITIGIITNNFIFNHENHIYFMLISFGVLASVSSFMFFNWSPAKMYMGDNGSQFLGAFLAIMGILFFWNTHVEEKALIDKQFIAVGFAFLVPLTDTITVTINRILRGDSPFIGGKDHTTHHLSYLGLSDKNVARVVLVFSLASVSVSLIIINAIDDWKTIHSIIFGGLGLMIFTTMFLITKFTKPKG